MKYINAKSVLPSHLLKELQEYVPGELVYVPGKAAVRAAWGEVNGTREKYAERNETIVYLYKNGSIVKEIAKKYHLSECCIRKIINGKRAMV